MRHEREASQIGRNFCLMGLHHIKLGRPYHVSVWRRGTIGIQFASGAVLRAAVGGSGHVLMVVGNLLEQCSQDSCDDLQQD